MSIPISQATLRQLQRLPVWTEAVARLLHGPGIGSVWVQVGRFGITPQAIRRVGDAIRAENIKVYYDPGFVMVNNAFAAFYDGGYDAMFTGFCTLDTIGRKAVLVHEATHAANDMKRRSTMLHVDDEAAGYVAQAMYIRGTGVRAPIRLTSPTAVIDDIYKASFDVADAIFGGIGHPVDLLDTLRDKILANPNYSVTGTVTATGSDSTVFGMLTGTGTFQTGTRLLTVYNTISPGTAGPGVLHTGNVKLNGGYTVDLNGTAALMARQPANTTNWMLPAVLPSQETLTSRSATRRQWATRSSSSITMAAFMPPSSGASAIVSATCVSGPTISKFLVEER
jgi:hypothetical protein